MYAFRGEKPNLNQGVFQPSACFFGFTLQSHQCLPDLAFILWDQFDHIPLKDVAELPDECGDFGLDTQRFLEFALY